MLLATLTALVLWAGQALGGHSGFMVALGVAGVMNIGAYWWSDKLILRMYGAREVSPAEAPNAFATGCSPQHAAVAVTVGILRLLDREELEGVLAHELSHIRHRDTLIMTISASLAGALSMMADMAMWGALFGFGGSNEDEDGHPFAGLLGIIVAPFAASLIQLAISRSREFLADEIGAQLTHNPLALARALRKLEAWRHAVSMTTGSPVTAHLFIVNFFTGGGLAQLV